MSRLDFVMGTAVLTLAMLGICLVSIEIAKHNLKNEAVAIGAGYYEVSAKGKISFHWNELCLSPE